MAKYLKGIGQGLTLVFALCCILCLAPVEAKAAEATPVFTPAYEGLVNYMRDEIARLYRETGDTTIKKEDYVPEGTGPEYANAQNLYNNFDHFAKAGLEKYRQGLEEYQDIQNDILQRIAKGEDPRNIKASEYGNPGSGYANEILANETMKKLKEEEAALLKKAEGEDAKKRTADSCVTPDPVETRKKYEKICWYCRPFITILQAIGETTQAVFDNVAKACMNLIAVGFALWLAFMTAFYMFQSRGGAEYINKVGTQTLRVVFAIGLLAMGTKALTLVFSPVLNIALDYGGVVARSQIEYRSSTGIEVLDLISSAVLPTDGTDIGANTSIGSMNGKIMGIYAYAVTMMRYSVATGFKCIFPRLELLAIAVVIGIFAVILMIVIPLKVVDALIRLAIVMILMPLFIVAWTFPITRRYAGAGWTMFMGVAFFILFLGLSLTITVNVIDAAVAPFIDNLPADKNDALKYISSIFNLVSKDFLFLIGALFFCWKIIGSASALSKEFGGSAGSGDMMTKAAAGAVALTGAAAAASAYATYKGAEWAYKNRNKDISDIGKDAYGYVRQKGQGAYNWVTGKNT